MFLTSIRTSVDEGGDNVCLDATIAYRRACLHTIAYAPAFGTPAAGDVLIGPVPGVSARPATAPRCAAPQRPTWIPSARGAAATARVRDRPSGLLLKSFLT